MTRYWTTVEVGILFLLIVLISVISAPVVFPLWCIGKTVQTLWPTFTVPMDESDDD